MLCSASVDWAGVAASTAAAQRLGVGLFEAATPWHTTAPVAPPRRPQPRQATNTLYGDDPNCNSAAEADEHLWRVTRQQGCWWLAKVCSARGAGGQRRAMVALWPHDQHTRNAATKAAAATPTKNGQSHPLCNTTLPCAATTSARSTCALKSTHTHATHMGRHHSCGPALTQLGESRGISDADGARRRLAWAATCNNNQQMHR